MLYSSDKMTTLLIQKVISNFLGSSLNNVWRLTTVAILRFADAFTWMTNLECPLKSEVLKTAFRWKHLKIAIFYTLQQSHLFLCLGFQHEYKRAWCDRLVEWSNNMIRLTNIWLLINSGMSQTRVKQCIKAFQMDGRQSIQEPQMRKYLQTPHYDSITWILNHKLPSTFLNQLFIMFILTIYMFKEHQ